MRRRSLALVLAILAAGACSGGGPSGPPVGGIEGGYTGLHSFTINIGVLESEVTCNGSLVVVDVTASGALTGSLTIDPCQAAEKPGGTTGVSGTLSRGGAVSFIVPNQQEFVDPLRNKLQCIITRIDPGFSGTLQNGRLDASITATLTCQDIEGPVQSSWRVHMAKLK